MIVDNFYYMDWLVKSKKANYQGNYNFQLVLSEDDIDSSSTISIMAFTDSSQKAVVPCSYTWFIIKNGVPQEIPDFRGSSFICETSHIGYLVQAHITVICLIFRATICSIQGRP